MPDDNSENRGVEQADLSDNRPKDRTDRPNGQNPGGVSGFVLPGVWLEPDLDIAELRVTHDGLIADLNRLAAIKGRADAGAIEHAVFEAELRAVADKYKKQGLTTAKARAAVEQRLRPPMKLGEAKKQLIEAGGQRDEVLQLGLAGVLWHDPDLEAYATIEHGGRRETWKVKSRDYRLYLGSEYRNRHGRVPSGQALSEGIEAIEAEAREGREHEVFVRVAGADGKIYLDLANEAWTVVEIDAAGWRVIGRPPVHFIRPRGLRALSDPQPCNGGDGIAKLQALVNLQGDDFILYVSWIVGCLQALGPYPILVLSGEHGAAKTSTAKIACDLVDPAKVKASGPPRSEEHLAIAAGKRHILPYDNWSGIGDWLADALCRLSTGGGLQKRMLFTDDEQSLLSACRPVVLTAIPDLTARADLADRAIVATLRPITEEARLTEAELLAKFEQGAPEILGALLNGVVLALRDRARLAKEMTQKPRMADFAVWAAAAPAFGWTGKDFLGAYNRNREEAIAHVLEADPLADAVRDFAQQADSWGPLTRDDGTEDWGVRVWKDTATALLGELGKLVPEETRRERGWPKDATRLSERLRRLAPGLRTRQIKVDRFREREDLPDGGKGDKRRWFTVTVPEPRKRGDGDRGY